MYAIRSYYDKLLDAAYEKEKGASKIGSTLRGIGPAYTDKYSRNGVRIGDILLPGFKEKMKKAIDAHFRILDYYEVERPSDMQMMDFYAGLDVIRSYIITETEYVLNDWMKQGKNILAEGAQGTMLDVDFGSYPFVTSSNTSCAGAPVGMGIPPSKIGTVYGFVITSYSIHYTKLYDSSFSIFIFSQSSLISLTGTRRCTLLTFIL